MSIEEIAGFTVVVLIVVDLVGRATWTRLYFRSGLLCYRRRLHLKHNVTLGGLDAYMTRRMRSDIPPGVEFKQLSESELAFRQQSWASRGLRAPYTPVMHGSAEAQSSERTVTVSGRLNWWALAVLVVLLYVLCSQPFSSNAWLWCALCFSFLGICYALQIGQFDKVSDELFSYLKH